MISTAMLFGYIVPIVANLIMCYILWVRTKEAELTLGKLVLTSILVIFPGVNILLEVLLMMYFLSEVNWNKVILKK